MKKLFFLLLLPMITLGQSSMNMNLLGTYDYPSTKGNDIWGWVDNNGDEFALVGLRSGFSVVNVTNPSSPLEEFFIPDVNSIWRDVKTWGNYAYITTEANAGLLIVDLTDMTGNTYSHVTQFVNNNGGSVSFTSAHDIYIDENGIAYIFGAGGAGLQSNGSIFLDVGVNPMNPVYLGEWSDEYIHDGMVRGDTMYAGCINTGKVFIVDVSDKSNPVSIGSHTTPNAFTHNAWVSDDGDYVFTTDEKPDAYLAAYDISDINNIQEVDRIQSNPGSNAIPHNTFVDGNFLITSYYRDGTTVHDITHPNYMIQVAYYDSYSGSGSGYDGCWGTYPYLPSGNIISSDINSGAGGNGKLLIYGRNFLQACYLQGNIYDGLTGSIIANAGIEILTTINSETSNLLGYYQTAILDSGTYQVVFSANGYISDTIPLLLTNGVMIVQDVFLYTPCDNLNISITNYDTICDGQSLIVGVNLYNQSGVYTDTIISSNGCDSVVTSIISVIPISTFSNYQTICLGDSIVVANNVYYNVGIYSDTLQTINGCDSVINTNLTILPEIIKELKIEICDGESVIIGNSTYTLSGNYVDTLTNSYGCDSIMLIDLTVSNPVGVINLNAPQIIVTAVGGLSPYDYTIYGPNSFVQQFINTSGFQSFYPSINGQHYFIATDALGCQSQAVYCAVDFPLTINNIYLLKRLVKITDILGKNIKKKKSATLFYHFDDGTIEKKIIIE